MSYLNGWPPNNSFPIPNWPLQKIPWHTIILFICYPQNWISIVFSFSWGHFNSQEKLKTMLMQNFGVTNKEHYGMLWYFLEWSIAHCDGKLNSVRVLQRYAPAIFSVIVFILMRLQPSTRTRYDRMRFLFYSLLKASSNRCVFVENGQPVGVAGRPKWIEMYAISNENVLDWIRPRIRAMHYWASK